jgi:hypothetical protein
LVLHDRVTQSNRSPPLDSVSPVFAADAAAGDIRGR